MVDAHMICNKCKTDKPVDCFSNEKRNVTNSGKRYQCKACDSADNKAWRKQLSPDQRSKLYANNRRYYDGSLKGKAIFLFNSIKERCKRTNRAIGIDADLIHGALQAGKCAATGFYFRYVKSERGGITPFSPSVDRINSQLDYVPENVQIVCSIYNMGKAHHDELDFIAMCLAVAEKHKDNQPAIDRMNELRSL